MLPGLGFLITRRKKIVEKESSSLNSWEQQGGPKELNEKHLLVVGNPVVDYSLVVNFAWMADNGWKVQEGCDRPQTSGQHHKLKLMSKIMGSPKQVAKPGGCGLNSARAAGLFASTLPKGESIQVAFSGCVGEDTGGKLVRESCGRCGVLPWLFTVPGGLPTGSCAIAVDEASRDRTILCDRGAAGELNSGMLSPATPWVKEWMHSSHSVLMATSLLLSTPQRAQVVSRLAEAFSGQGRFVAEAGPLGDSGGGGSGGAKEFVLALGMASALQQPLIRRRARQLLPATSIVVGSIQEVCALAGCCGPLEAGEGGGGGRLGRCRRGIREMLVSMRGGEGGEGGGGLVLATDGAKPLRLFRLRPSPSSSSVGAADTRESLCVGESRRKLRKHLEQLELLEERVFPVRERVPRAADCFHDWRGRQFRGLLCGQVSLPEPLQVGSGARGVGLRRYALRKIGLVCRWYPTEPPSLLGC